MLSQYEMNELNRQLYQEALDERRDEYFTAAFNVIKNGGKLSSIPEIWPTWH